MSPKRIISATILMTLIMLTVFTTGANSNPKPQISAIKQETKTSFEKIDSVPADIFGARLLIKDSGFTRSEVLDANTFNSFSSKSGVKAASSQSAPKADAEEGGQKTVAKPYYPLTAAQRDKIERVLMSSCGAYGSLMAKANAQVILDRVQSGRFGKTVDEVLDAPHQFEKPYEGRVNSKVKEAVRMVFDRGERVTDTQIFYYINPYYGEISPAVWSRGKRYVVTIGKGKFIHEYWTDSDI